ncbi:PREDICTED: cyclin-T1-3 isoform X1 [Camelina sativa]|uniref:Cyclin-T1-3 isoform X1 n=2 Tax=Camelina sativa TaxID=90675 RepID=A0ABM0WYS9_CAMSA|nr:PREDICTED: cyclin-T1-3 isoform X1 [Camelina sativa]XP_010478104.1 PREDICTED: cyclin-T1-3 isoform X1 [Camelina sativa]
MGEEHPRKRSRQHFETETTRHVTLFESPQCELYFTREEIERFSPSRKDGIDLVKESFLRSSYCTFLQRLGMNLHVSQVTIACAMMMCHRFYMRQSHAKNDWQTIATASLFLACKAEDEPCQLSSVVVASYEIIYEWDPSASIRIHQTECYHEFKEIVLAGERLLLDTSAFLLDIELPYKPLAAALNRLNAWPDLATSAWNFVHDWLRTTLCLQYKPHVIATATVHLAASFQNAKVGSRRDWWLEFGVTTKLLKEVIQEMYMLIEVDRRRTMPPPPPPPRRELTWAIPAPMKPVHMARGHPFHSYPLQSYRQAGIW